MSLAVVRSAEPDASGERQRLLERRDALGAELARLGRPASLKGAADKVLAEVSAELHALDEAERAAWSAWAASPDAATEPEVESAKRVDERCEWVAFASLGQSLAQTADMDIDRAVVDLHAAAPYAIQQLRA